MDKIRYIGVVSPWADDLTGSGITWTTGLVAYVAEDVGSVAKGYPAKFEVIADGQPMTGLPDGTVLLPDGTVFVEVTAAVVDGLASTSATDALSANQGRVLKDAHDALVGVVAGLGAGGGGTSYAEVLNYAALPASPAAGTTCIVLQPQGVWLINRKPAGLYRFTAGVWVYLGEVPDGYFVDNVLRFFDNADASKQLAFELGSITSGNVRTLTVPDKSGTIATMSDIPAGGSMTGADITTALNAYLGSADWQGGGAGGSALPTVTTWSTTWDTAAYKDMGSYTVTGALAIVSSDTGSVRGGCTQAVLIADGTNVPTLDGSAATAYGYTNTAGARNLVQLFRAGGARFWACGGNVGTDIAAVSAPTSLTMTGPSTSVVGSASTAFTVTANATATSAITLTPSDGGAGGTFSPTSPTIAAGSASTTFTYTAGSMGAKTVSVSNGSGLTGPASATLTAITQPGAPTGLTLGSATTSAQPLTWTAPASTGGSALTDYVVQYAPAGSGSWTTFSDGTSTSTSATVTGLTGGTSYDYRVAAVNAAGTGTYSGTATGSTAAGASTPGAPSSIGFGTVSATQIPMSWVAPASDGGSAITDYVIETALAGSGSWTVYSDGTSAVVSAIIVGLSQGTNYDIRVAAVNAIGQGPWSSTATKQTATVPGAPTGLTLGTATSVSQPLTWTAPSYTGEVALTDYVIQYAPAGSGTWSTFAHAASTSASITVTGLSASTSYDYRVAAVNSVGAGAYSSTATGSTGAATSTVNTQLTTVAGITQTGDESAGWTYTSTAANASFSGSQGGISSLKIPSGAGGHFQATLSGWSSGNGFHVGLKTTSATGAFGTSAVGLYVRSSSVYNVSTGATGSVTPSAGALAAANLDMLRVGRDADGTTAWAEKSSDSGATWTRMHTWTGISGNLYLLLNFGGAGVSALDVEGFGVS